MARSRQAGLTLVEIMISLAVLAFVLLGFMSIMASASSFSETTRENLLASYELQSAVEDSLGKDYSSFVVQFTNGPTSTGTTGDYNNPPTPSTHPLEKYWSTPPPPVGHPRTLKEEKVWMEIISTSADSTAYKIWIQWKSVKGYYIRDYVYMQRASR